MPELQFVKVCECGCGQPTTVATRNRASTGMTIGQPLRFARGHNVPPRDVRFWLRVDKTPTCWLWTGGTDRGYGCFYLGSGSGRTTYAHRYAYEQVVGPIPEGMVLDHLCRVRNCVNPAHLDPVTDLENFRRGAGSSGVLYEPPTVCQRGHDISTPEGYYWTSGQRYCKECHRMRQSTHDARKAGQSIPGLVIRKWAWANGLDCADVGRIPSRIVRAFNADRAPGELPEVEE